MPKDVIVYATALTLVVFLLFRLPGIRQRVKLAGGDDHATGLGASATLMVMGIAILTVELWAGPTHTIDGINYARVFSPQLTLLGGTLVAAGLSLWAYPLLERPGREILPERNREASDLLS